MVKNWGDYGISAVKYNSEETHIEQVQIHKNVDGNVGNAEVWSRLQVVSKLNAGYTIITLTQNGGKWYIGAKVIVVTINGNNYIKTVNDGTANDNLENLPRF